MDLQTANNAANVLSPIFQMMGWTWNEESRPPTHSQIVGTVIDLASECHEAGENMSTGRIMVERTGDGWEVSLNILIMHDHAAA